MIDSAAPLPTLEEQERDLEHFMNMISPIQSYLASSIDETPSYEPPGSSASSSDYMVLIQQSATTNASYTSSATGSETNWSDNAAYTDPLSAHFLISD